MTLSILLAGTATTATTAGAASAAGSRACALARVLAHGALHPAHAVGSPGGTLFIGFDPTLQHRPGAAAAATDVSVAESFSRGSSLCAPLGGLVFREPCEAPPPDEPGLLLPMVLSLPCVVSGLSVRLPSLSESPAAFARLPKERPTAASNAMPVLLVCALFICLSFVHWDTLPFLGGHGLPECPAL